MILKTKILILFFVVGIVLICGCVNNPAPDIYDRSCVSDEDCIFTCYCGAINKNEICNEPSGIMLKCLSEAVVKCINNTCYEWSEIPAAEWYELNKTKLAEDKLPADVFIGHTCPFLGLNLSNPNSKILEIASEHCADLDDDNLYDYLAINTKVNITETGNYLLTGILLSGENKICSEIKEISYSSVFVFPLYLEQGIRTIDLNFSGEEIYRKKQSGIYAINLSLCGMSNETIHFDSKTFNLSYYNYTQFQKPRAEIIEIYEYGEHINKDDLFDYLTIEVQLDVWKSGNYTIYGLLETEYHTSITEDKVETHLDKGKHNIKIRFEGTHIYKSKINGSFILNLELLDEFKTYNTSKYNYTEFQRPKVEFIGVFSDFADFGADSDNDGKYDYLVVNLGINVRKSGDYMISAWLQDMYGKDICYNIDRANKTRLFDSREIQNLTLYFDGISINDHGIDGFFKIGSLVIYDANDNVIDAIDNPYNTSFYKFTDFEPTSKITGFITDDRGQPISKTHIMLHSRFSSLGAGITDDKGYYFIGKIKKGNYTINILTRENPYLPDYENSINLAEGQTKKFNITINRQSIAIVRILDNENNSIIIDKNSEFIQLLSPKRFGGYTQEYSCAIDFCNYEGVNLKKGEYVFFIELQSDSQECTFRYIKNSGVQDYKTINLEKGKTNYIDLHLT